MAVKVTLWSPTLSLKYENSKKFLGAHEVSNCSIIDELAGIAGISKSLIQLILMQDFPVLAEKLNSQSEKCII